MSNPDPRGSQHVAPILDATIYVRTHSEANRRAHWASKARDTSQQRSLATEAVRGLKCDVLLPAVVELVRVAPRRLDSDNLARAMKAVRDGVADTLGVDDADERLAWVYRQAKGKEYAVRIRIYQATLACPTCHQPLTAG